jgi:plasmid stabilization system protein ParE
MERRVVWAHSAEEDLEAAAAYMRRDSPAYAASFVNRALQAGRLLRHSPERGRIVPEFQSRSIREILVQSHRLIYRIEDDQISIVALIHGRREFVTAWYERER